MTRTSNQTEEQRKLAEKLAKEAALSVLSQTKLGEVEENKDNGDGVVDIKLEDETLVAEFAIKKEEFFKRISAVRPEFLSSRDAATLERVLEVLNGNSKVEEKLRIVDAIANPSPELSSYIKALDEGAKKSFYRRTKDEHNSDLKGFTELSQTAKVVKMLSDIDAIIGDLEDESIPLEHRKVLQQILNSYCNSGDLKVVLPWLPKTIVNGKPEDFKYDVRLGGFTTLWKQEGEGFWDGAAASSLYQDVSLWSDYRATSSTSLSADLAKMASCIEPSVPKDMVGFKSGFIDKFAEFARKKLNSIGDLQRRQKIEDGIKLMIGIKIQLLRMLMLGIIV